MTHLTLPDPGLLGNYAGSCIACLQGTDSGLCVAGSNSWISLVFQVFGIPGIVADAMVENLLDDFRRLPDGDIEVPFRVCARCVAKAGAALRAEFPRPVLFSPGVPFPVLRDGDIRPFDGKGRAS